MKVPKQVYAGIGIAVAVSLALTNSLLLRGEVIMRERCRLGDTFELEVPESGVKYLIAITSTRSSKRRKNYFLHLTIAGPDGSNALDYEESLPHKSARYINFVPETAGKYKIKIGGKGFASNPSLRLKIYIGDKRILRIF